MCIRDRLGRLDCLLSFAHQARMLDYNRPEFNDEGIIEIIQGRHPIIESMMGHDKTCLLYTSPSPRDRTRSRMPSSA